MTEGGSAVTDRGRYIHEALGRFEKRAEIISPYTNGDEFDGRATQFVAVVNDEPAGLYSMLLLLLLLLQNTKPVCLSIYAGRVAPVRASNYNKSRSAFHLSYTLAVNTTRTRNGRPDEMNHRRDVTQDGLRTIGWLSRCCSGWKMLLSLLRYSWPSNRQTSLTGNPTEYTY